MAFSATLTAPDESEFREQRRLKRTNSSKEAGPSSAKKQGWSKKSEAPVATRTSVIPTRSYFVPLRMVEVDSVSTAADGAESEPRSQQHPPKSQKR